MKWIISWQFGHFGAGTASAFAFAAVAAPNWAPLDMYCVYTFGFSFIISYDRLSTINFAPLMMWARANVDNVSTLRVALMCLIGYKLLVLLPIKSRFNECTKKPERTTERTKAQANLRWSLKSYCEKPRNDGYQRHTYLMALPSSTHIFLIFHFSLS